MMKNISTKTCPKGIGLITLYLFLLSLPAASQNWPCFRGPQASGIQDESMLPDTWDVSSGHNIKWKIDIPGLGHSSPVIWEDQLFVTTAISSSGNDGLKVGLYGDIDEVEDDSSHEFWLYSIDVKSGDVLWKQLSYKGEPATRRHTKASHANPTPVTNGRYVLAFYGSEGLYCYDMAGKLVWKKQFGRMNAGPYNSPDTEWGFASSPMIFENRVIVQCDFLGNCFISALDINTGEEVWKTPREEISTWSSPNIFQFDDQVQVVVNGYKHMGGYDFYTGQEIWKMSGGGDAPVPTPIYANGLIYLHNAHGRYAPIYAIKPTAKGDITLGDSETANNHIVWSIKRGAAYMPTNLVYGGYLYNMRMNGALSCFDALSGELIFKERISEARGITASAVAAKGKLYYSTEQGYVFVIRASNKFEVISKNNLDDIVMATPAISDNKLFFRTQHHLIAVGY